MYQELASLVMAVTDVRTSYAALNQVVTITLVILVLAKMVYRQSSKNMALAKEAQDKDLAKKAQFQTQFATGLAILSAPMAVGLTVANPTVARITNPFVETFRGGGKTFSIGGNTISVGLVALIVLIVIIGMLIISYKRLSVVQFLLLGLALYIVSLAVPPLREVNRFLLSVYTWFIEFIDSMLGRPGAVALIALTVVAVLAIDLLGDLFSRFLTPITSRIALVATAVIVIGAFYTLVQLPLVKSVVDPFARAALNVGQMSGSLDQSRVYIWFIVAVILAIALFRMIVKASGITVAGLVTVAFLAYAASFVWPPALSFLQGAEQFVYGTLGVLNSALSGVTT